MKPIANATDMTAKPAMDFAKMADSKVPESWKPAASGGLLDLNDPNFAFKYINISVQGDTFITDASFQRQYNEGWRPVKISDYPQLQSPAFDHISQGGFFQRRGQVLCKLPRKLAEERNAHYRAVDAKNRGAGLRQAVQQADSRLPVTHAQVKTEQFIGNNVREL